MRRHGLLTDSQIQHYQDHGYLVVDGKEEIGVVTSGTHSPTLKKPIGLAYLPLEKSAPGTEFMVLIRGKETRARVVPTPFYKRPR